MDRRQRQREATTAEIREVARRQMAQTRAAALSLRAVAREMGLTAPALDRYYDDRDALLTALVVEAYEGLNSALEQAAAARSTGDVAARVVAACLAWRHWAVTRPHEFALVFGTPVPGFALPEDGPTTALGERFEEIFLTLFLDAYRAHPFALPPAEHLTPPLEQALSVAGVACGGPLPAGAMQLFLAAWAVLHGLISLEVFGHLQWVGLPDHEALYRSEVAALLQRMGLDPAGAQRQAAPEPRERSA